MRKEHDQNAQVPAVTVAYITPTQRLTLTLEPPTLCLTDPGQFCRLFLHGSGL